MSYMNGPFEKLSGLHLLIGVHRSCQNVHPLGWRQNKFALYVYKVVTMGDCCYHHDHTACRVHGHPIPIHQQLEDIHDKCCIRILHHPHCPDSLLEYP